MYKQKIKNYRKFLHFLLPFFLSYVAATGLPTPQKNHAIIMVKFARECIQKMGQVVNELAIELGEDTNTLRMRVGIHSGRTTAGVLRGIKGRFQLFGDSVNTASRMESTGAPGRIQISQSTAHELMMRGKGHWLTARQDLVEAKGKGMMQTYYVSVVDAAKSCTTGSGQSPDSSSSVPSAKGFVPKALPEIEDVSEARNADEEEEDKSIEEQLKGYLSKGEKKLSLNGSSTSGS